MPNETESKPLNPSFAKVANTLPMADFAKLMGYLSSPDTKTYIREITSVTKQPRGDNGGMVGMIRWVPVKNTQYPDVGEIPTNWLSNDLANLVCSIAKTGIKKRCLIFQINKDRDEKQPNGYRECVWVQVLEGHDG